MSKTFYKQTLERAQEELENLMSQREEIDARIVELNESIVNLARLAQETPRGKFFEEMKKMGLTDACREVLKRANQTLTPLEVKDRLRRIGYDLSKYEKDVLPSIHTVLKRLVKNKEAEVRVTATGKKVYFLKDKYFPIEFALLDTSEPDA
jgi:intracellular sulfur oxidation DsrE/DsrF family protein